MDILKIILKSVDWIQEYPPWARITIVGLLAAIAVILVAVRKSSDVLGDFPEKLSAQANTFNISHIEQAHRSLHNLPSRDRISAEDAKRIARQALAAPMFSYLQEESDPATALFVALRAQLLLSYLSRHCEKDETYSDLLSRAAQNLMGAQERLYKGLFGDAGWSDYYNKAGDKADGVYRQDRFELFKAALPAAVNAFPVGVDDYVNSKFRDARSKIAMRDPPPLAQPGP